MSYVCKSLGWWQTEVLVLGLKWVPSSQDMEGFLLPATTGRRADSLTVPLPMDALTLIGLLREDALEQFMQKLTRLLMRLDMELARTELISTALISLAENVRNSLSMRDFPWYTMVLTTE